MSLFFPALCVAVAGAMSAWEWRRYALGKASLHWCPVQGTVVDVWFDEKEVDFYNDVHMTSANLVYDYVVSGRRHRCKRFTYRPTYGLDQQDAYALLQGLRRGQSVEVRYDPEHPQRAVVIAGTDNGNLLRLGTWGLMLILSIGYFFTAFLLS
jgi:hypothetical protein